MSLTRNCKKQEKEKTLNNFESLDTYLASRRRFIISIWAGTGVGKSYFALTAPKPIYFLSMEPDGPYWALQTAIESKLIKPDDVLMDEVIRTSLKSSNPPLVRGLSEDIKIYNHIKNQIEEIISDGEDGGTLVIDTGTSWNQLMQKVEMEDIMKKRKAQGRDAFAFDYRYANDAMKSSIDAIRNSNLNCVITHHGQPEYNAKGEALNRMKYSGNNYLQNWVDLQLELRYTKETKQRYAIFEKCRVNVSKVGSEVDDPNFNNILESLGI